MIDHTIKEVIIMFNRSSRYREEELKASITTDCGVVGWCDGTG